MTLVEVAKARQRKRRQPSREQVDLAVAFFRGEITSTQAKAALSDDPSDCSVYQQLAAVLRNAICLGMATVEVRL